MALKSEILERTLFEALRLQLIEEGYLPDMTTFSPTPAGAVSFNQAKEQIKSSKGFYIDIIGASDQDSKGPKNTPKIIVYPQEPEISQTMGMDTSKFYEKVGQSFVEKNNSTSAILDYYINIHLISYTTQQRRVLTDIAIKAIPKRGYMKELVTLKSIFIETIARNTLDDPDTGIMERVINYRLPDQMEDEPELSDIEIAPLNEITIENYFNGLLLEDSLIIN